MKQAIPAVLVTGKTIVIHHGQQTFTLERNTPKGETIFALYKERDWDKLIQALAPANAIPVKTGGLFTVSADGNLYAIGDDAPIHTVIAKRLLSFVQEGLPCEALVAFWNNLKQNPSQRSIDQLYSFLEANHHPLTDDGCFLAYKKVTRMPDGSLKDSHSRTFNNNIGEHVTMQRDKVNPNPEETCSTGLHVASFEYAQGFSGNVLVVVKVNPKDVVAVPVDYNKQKMRTCAYTVLELYTGQEEMKQNLVVETKTLGLAATVTPKERMDMVQRGFNPLVEKDIQAYRTYAPAIETTKKSSIQLSNLTASQIVNKVVELLKDSSLKGVSLKNKQSILKKATKLFTDKGWKVS